MTSGAEICTQNGFQHFLVSKLNEQMVVSACCRAWSPMIAVKHFFQICNHGVLLDVEQRRRKVKM